MKLLKSALVGIVLTGSCCISLAQPSRKDCTDEIRQAEKLLYRFLPEAALEKFNSAMQMAGTLHHDSLYAVALFGAGQAQWYKSDFSGAAGTVKAALQQFQKRNDLYNTGVALRILSNIYDDQGEYEKAFVVIQQALDLYEGYQDAANEVLALVQTGALYKTISDYEAAMQFYKKAVAKNPPVGEYAYRELYHRLGELYVARKQVDSARYFYRKAFTGNPNSKIIRLSLGESYLNQHNADKALAFIQPLYGEATNATDVMILIATSLDLARIYQIKNKPDSALPMALQALRISEQRGQRQGKRDAYGLLSVVYEAKDANKKALQYQKLFQKLQDSLLSDQFKGRLYAFKQNAANHEQFLSLQTQKRTMQRSLIFISLVALLVLGLILLRHKNEKLRLRQRASELEMQALRAQMNPHFIFNCLTAINHFILTNETEKATEYLTGFSKLLRLVLINAGKAVVSLEEELGMLRLYLNMEQLRFKEAFDYRIHVDSPVQPSLLTTPSFLLQPFCENAIWHGLLHKEGKGELNISFYLKDSTLICEIVDNGIGRKRAAYMKKRSVEKGPAFGHKLSAERLALFNRESIQASFLIHDLTPEKDNTDGTRVTLKIRQPDGV